MTKTAPKGHTGAPARSALDDLLAAEREIAQRDEAASREADAILAAAREEVSSIERDAALALAAELTALDTRATASQATRVREVEVAAARHAARYRSVRDAELERLVSFVVSAVTGLPVDAIK